MRVTRRSLLGSAAAAGLFPCWARSSMGADESDGPPAGRFDPWVEVLTDNLRFNIRQVRRLTGNRPILAVVKNNAYGLGVVETARFLESSDAISGFAVVKVDAAIKLRDAGIVKPVLHMGICSGSAARELLKRNVQLSLYTDDAAKRVSELAQATGRPVTAHLYLDTGLGRLGMPYHRALPWIQDLSKRKDLKIAGTFMAFTEQQDFDPEQLDRFKSLVRALGRNRQSLGQLHAASSNGVFHLPDAHLDLVRPGIALYGAYPSRPEQEKAKAELRPAVRLRCRVVRVEQLRPGDSAGYGRKYVAQRPTWLATLPAGHVDGVVRASVQGARALIGQTSYRLVGAVSASHCLVELGEQRTVEVGDLATLVGPDAPEIHPNVIEKVTGASVYDVLMHLNPALPRFVRTG